MANALRTLVNVWSDKEDINHVNGFMGVCKNNFGTNMLFAICNSAFPTVTGVPVLPQVVALSAVALVGSINVCTLLVAWAGQTLIHIWRLEVRTHYCHNLIKEFSMFLP